MKKNAADSTIKCNKIINTLKELLSNCFLRLPIIQFCNLKKTISVSGLYDMA
jgi:hypothetical protein